MNGPNRRSGPPAGVRIALLSAILPLLAVAVYLLWRMQWPAVNGIDPPAQAELAALGIASLVSLFLLVRHSRRLHSSIAGLGAMTAPDSGRPGPAEVTPAHPGELAQVARQIEMLLRSAREMERNYRFIAAETADCLFLAGLDGRHHWLNAACEQLYGHSQAELAADPDMPWRSIHPEDRPAYRALLARPPGEAPMELRFRVIQRDGALRWIAHRSHPWRDDAGQLLGHCGRQIDITPLRTAEAAHQRALNLADSLMAIAPTLILELDQEGRIVRFNTPLEALTGYSLAEVRGRDWFTLCLPERRRRASHALFRHNLDNPAPRAYVDILVTRHGEERVIEWQDVPLRADAGCVTGLLATGSDTGASNQTGAATADAVPSPPLPTEETAGAPTRPPNHPGGELPPGGEWVAIRCEDVLAAVLCMISPQATAKGLRLGTDCDRLPAGLLGAPTRLTHALLNYASNAVRHTGMGTVTLRTRRLEETPTSLLVRFEVEDTGIGVDPAILPHLFHAFDRPTPDEGGIPRLGLALTRYLARQMGGEAGAASVPGSGSTFWFTARLWKGDARPTTTDPAPTPPPADRPPTHHQP